MRLACPGKIFITGEYSCISGGPALLGTVGPAFELFVEPISAVSGTPRDRESTAPALAFESPFHPNSPAGLLLRKYADDVKDQVFRWIDPYETAIGVGSSSAQFILSLAAIAKLREEPLPSPGDALRLYWNIVGDSQGTRPSGADVVAQWIGGPIVFRNEPFSADKLGPWDDASVFVLAHTGKKAKTHEQLASLRERGFPSAFRPVLRSLDAVTKTAIAAWRIGDAKALGAALNDYQRVLTEGDLAAPQFTTKFTEVQKWPGVLGCKGTGAQGGDCLLFLVTPTSYDSVADRIRAEGWSPIRANWTGTGLKNLS